MRTTHTLPDVGQNYILHSFHVIIKIKSIQLQFNLNSSMPQLLRAVQVLFPMQNLPNSQFGCPVYVSLIVVSCLVWTAIPFDNSTSKPNKKPREVTFSSFCCLLCLWCLLSFFSVRLAVSGVLKSF